MPEIPIPVMKTEVKIHSVRENNGDLLVYATPDAVQEMNKFGYTCRLNGDLYILSVDGRFDFSEVVNYVKGMEK